MLASDAAMRTSAAPTFFPVHQGYVDGAVFATNPSLMALARVFESYPHLSRRNVSVLSMGCGDSLPTLSTSTPGLLASLRCAVSLRCSGQWPSLALHSKSNEALFGIAIHASGTEL